MPLAAFDRGAVYFEHRSSLPGNSRVFFEPWLFEPQWDYAVAAGATPLIYKLVPMFGSGHFFIPATNEVVFHNGGTVSVWDGVNHIFTEPGLGYTELFHDDAELGEIAPMRSGNFLVPERAAFAKLIEFNLNGRVAEIPFPNSIGSLHIELLGDQCTLLYSVANRVARMNICTGAALSDFAALAAGETAGSIRALPNGDVLVASGNAVVQFTAAGALLRTYPFAGVTHIALTPDGGGFYAGGVSAGKATLRFYGPPKEIPLGNPEMTDAFVPEQADDLVVVGEWRAATAVPIKRLRAVR
jgi:hypothetical protein